MYSDFRSFLRAAHSLLAATGVAALCVAASTPALARQADNAGLADESNVSDWLGYGRTYSGQRFSPLKQVNASTVAGLGVDWSLDLTEDSGVGLTCTPLVSDGVMYFQNARNVVRAVSATSGKLLWTYDPQVIKTSGSLNRMPLAYLHGGRGIALWKDKVYVATVDGRLIAIDTRTGREGWSVRTFPASDRLYNTGAPLALHGKILVGNGGSEVGLTRGFVSAYDAETGKLAWRFYIVPGDPKKGFESKAMEMAAKTWKGRWWEYGGGGQNWAQGFTYDPDFNAIYFGTGNGTPWNRAVRSPGGGDNLFLSSIVAVDADTGKYRWHYQTTPGEQWDYDSNSDMVLADLSIQGRKVKALLQAPKNGFFYVIDRATGKLVSAKPYTEVNWASGVDLKTGRPRELASADYTKTGSSIVTPGDWGAHSWPPMSFNPDTGLVYIPVMHEYSLFTTEGVDLSSWNSSTAQHPVMWGTGVTPIPHGGPYNGQAGGTLEAWDPIRQVRAWEVRQPNIWSPGTLTTAGGLVFQGNTDGNLIAYDATNGHVLWKYALGLGISAPPITYEIGGRQYVALLVGWGSGWAGARGADAADLGWGYGRQMRRLVAFSLDGKVQLKPQPPRQVATPLHDPSFKVDKSLAKQGEVLFGSCGFCHGGDAMSGGQAPDLRASAIVLSEQAFAAVVRGGGRTANNMPQFKDLTDADLLALRNYIRQQANLRLKGKGAPP